MSRIPSFLFVSVMLALSACTFNASPFQRDVSGESDPSSFTQLRADLRHVGGGFDGAAVTVRGADREGAAATVGIAGILGSEGDPDAIADGVAIEWLTDDHPIRDLDIGYRGPAAETVWVERVDIEVPFGTELDVATDSARVDVEGVDAPFAHVETDSGAIRVRDAQEVSLHATSGAIDAIAERGVITTQSGAIDMVLAGDVLATAQSGAISGSLGRGGTISTVSGAIDVALTTALDRDLTITASSGAITLVLPAGIAAQIEVTTSSGAIDVDAGGLEHHGRGHFQGAIGGGGPFTIELRADSGAITVIEQPGS